MGVACRPRVRYNRYGARGFIMTATAADAIETLKGLGSRLHRFSIADYRVMIENDILTDDGSLALHEGQIVHRPEQPVTANGAPAARARRFSVDEYHKLIELGVLPENGDA